MHPESTSRRIESAVCAGNARSLGREQGEAWRSLAQGASRALDDLDAFRLRRPWWLPYPLYRRFAEALAGRWLARPMARDLPALSDRLAGIAEGSQVPLRSLHLVNAMEAWMSSVTDCIACPAGCSAVAVRGDRSVSGEPILHKNFDYLPLVQPFYAIRDCRPEAGLRSLDFTVAALAGTIDGMNEKGLCLTLNYAFSTDQARPAPTITMAIADALAHCGDVGEAAERIAKGPRWGSGILMMADATGDIASLELSHTRSGLRRPGPGENHLQFTNVYGCDETRQVEIPATSVFAKGAPEGLLGDRVLECHAGRSQRIAELLAQRGKWDADGLAALMADHGPKGQPDASSPCVHTDYWRTTACLQLFPRSRRMRVSFTSACQAQYQEIAF